MLTNTLLKKKTYLFVAVLGGHCCEGPSRAAASRVILTGVTGFSMQWLLSLQSSRAQPQQLWCMGLAALQHVGSSQTRNQSLALAGGVFTTEPPALSKACHPEGQGERPVHVPSAS